MYKQHSFKYGGKYYAQIHGQQIEISKEIANAMDASYRKTLRMTDRDAAWGVLTDSAICRGEYEDMESSYIDSLPDQKCHVEEEVIQNLEKEMLHEMLGRLPSQDRWLLKRLYFEEITQKEVARELKVNQSTVLRRTRRILRKLREMYEEKG